jgi:hypothetical protein
VDHGEHDDVAVAELADRVPGNASGRGLRAEGHVGGHGTAGRLDGVPPARGAEQGARGRGRVGRVRRGALVDGKILPPAASVVGDADHAHGQGGDRDHAEDDGASPPAPDATLPAGDALAHALRVRVQIEGRGRIQTFAEHCVDVAHCALLGVLSTVRAARRVPRALWRAFFTAPSAMPSAPPIEATGWSR